jgi:type VI secretion system protein
MTAGNLLSRIQHPETAHARSGMTETELRDSILRNLRLMCMTRLGSVPSAPKLGVISVSDVLHSFPDAATMMARSIRDTIEQYEPRLTNVRVQFVPSATVELVLRFEVIGQATLGGRRTPISFETNIDPNRRMTVR